MFQHALKASDAIHLAAALLVRATAPTLDLEFWTADKQQAQAAETEGLLVQLIG